jgi:hypothetical protein
MAQPVHGVRRGDRVRIRGRAEILSTLDDKGTLHGLPFMPEMLEQCGREVTVYSRADKTCDTVDMTGATRQMGDTVHLAGLRCDGSAHGGCEAGCLFFWREEWLERPGAPTPARQNDDTPVKLLDRNTTVDSDAPTTIYACQATEVLKASKHISALALGQYVKDVRTGNERLPVVLRGLLIMVFNKYQWRIGRKLPRWLRIKGGLKYPFYQGTGTGGRTPILGLQVGELVEVKSKEEIMATLSADNRNRGMWFDGEMLPYVGKRFRVAGRVERIIHEKEGQMIKLSDCVTLEGVICGGVYHRFCQRAVLPYWREAWLRRVDEVAA